MMIRPAKKRQVPRKVSTGSSLSASLSIGQLTPHRRVRAASRTKPLRGNGSGPLAEGAMSVTAEGGARV